MQHILPHEGDTAQAPTPICPRCGSNTPSCTDVKPDGTRYTHAETCATYTYADDVCEPCLGAMSTPGKCAACGKDPADGFAQVNDDWLCHPDEGPSCYMGQSARPGGATVTAPTQEPPEMWGGGCECWVTPQSQWLSAASCGYGDGYEPGSQVEYNPDCPMHGARPGGAR